MARFWAAAVLVLGTLSCGGGGGAAGSCGQVEPCGGPVGGTWQASATCSSATVLNDMLASCPGAHATSQTGSPAGSMVLNADLTYAMSLSVPFVMNVSVPLSCSGAASCADVAASLGETVTGRSTPYSHAVCTGTSTCSCVLTQTASLAGTGTYVTSGTTLELTDASGSTNTGTYCVQANVLHLVGVDMTTNMGPMGQATITDDLVLTKP